MCLRPDEKWIGGENWRGNYFVKDLVREGLKIVLKFLLDGRKCFLVWVD